MVEILFKMSLKIPKKREKKGLKINKIQKKKGLSPFFLFKINRDF